MRNLMKCLSALACVLTLAGCEINTTGEGRGQTRSEEIGIQGPNISGTWVSGCYETHSAWKRIEVTFSANKVARRNAIYDDRDCNVAAKDTLETGTFRFIEASSDGTYTIEYKFPVGGGWSAVPKEKVLLSEDLLFLSDYVIGDIKVDSMISLERRQP